MAVLLRLSQRPHMNVVLLQPPRDGVRVAPFVLFIAVDLGYLNRAQLLFDIFLVKPVFVLIQRLVS